MLSGKNITENAIAIFFAFIPMMFLMGLLWFFIIIDADKARDYLSAYQRIAGSQQEQIEELQGTSHIHPDFSFKREEEQDNWIEILRTQMSQVKPIKK